MEKVTTININYEKLIHENAFMLCFVPPEHITIELCLIAVQKYSTIIARIFENPDFATIVKSPDINKLCVIAVTNNYNLYSIIPKKLCNKELDDLYQGIKNEYLHNKKPTTISTTRPKLITEYTEFIAAGIQRNGLLIKYIHKDIITPKMLYIAAISSARPYPMVFLYSPVHLLTTELCLTSVKHDGNSIKILMKKYTTNNLRKRELPPESLDLAAIIAASIKQNGNALKYILIDFRKYLTYDVCYSGLLSAHVKLHDIIIANYIYGKYVIELLLKYIPIHLIDLKMSLLGIKYYFGEKNKINLYMRYKNKSNLNMRNKKIINNNIDNNIDNDIVDNDDMTTHNLKFAVENLTKSIKENVSNKISPINIKYFNIRKIYKIYKN